MVYCPTCGAGLRFEIETQQMACDHCQNRFDPQALADKISNDAKTEKWQESYAYICPACGAELLTNDKQDAIGFCPYCGGASMIFDKIRRDWKTDYVIPFSVTKEQCKEAYVKEVKRHPLVSRKYCKPELIESFRGVYMPYWNYRAVLDGKFAVTAIPGGGMFLEKDADGEEYRLTGEVHRSMDGYSHDASIAFDDHLSEKLAPYDTSKQAPFNPGYLCGFYAEAGDADVAEYDRLAQQELQQHAFSRIVQQPQESGKLPPKLRFAAEKSSLPLKITAKEQVLYPVWFMSYRRKDKITYAMVNGQTGKVGADLPLSPLRILAAALGAAAALYGVLLLLMQLLPSVKAQSALALCALLSPAGLFVMEHAFSRTVKRALRNDITAAQNRRQTDKKKPADDAPLPGSCNIRLPRYLMVMALAALFFLIYVSDGSYDRLFGNVAGILFLVAAVLLLLFHIFQGMELGKLKNLTLSTESTLKSGILTLAQHMLTPMLLMRIFVLLAAAGCLSAAALDLANDPLYYGLSLFITAVLLGVCTVHLCFQTAVAKRRLPQFDKKGARYDEN